MASLLSHGRPSTLHGAQRGSAHPRQSSANLYASFDKAQIATFKEAFSLIDHDSDGLITEDDMRKMLESMGKPSSSAKMAPYFERSKSINFTLFLTMMSEHLLELDPEADLLEAFECLDEDDSGVINVADLRRALSGMGDRMSEAEPPFATRQGKFKYRDWIRTLRVFDADETAKHQAASK